MATEIHVEGLAGYQAEVAKHKGKRVFALFSGSKADSGASWCPDCVTAEPVVRSVIQRQASADDVFIHCSVGDRTAWKDPSNEFRVEEALKLKCVPTLMEVGTPKRLLEEDCSNAIKVELLFED